MNDEIIIAVGEAINNKYIEIMEEEFDLTSRTFPTLDDNQIYEFGELAISTYYKNRCVVDDEEDPCQQQRLTPMRAPEKSEL